MRDRKRTLLVVAGVATVALAAGLVAGSLLRAPADAAAETAAPEAGAITVPVERRMLESRVVTRGDASFAGAVEVTVQISNLQVPPIVTGGVPEVGDEVAEGEPLLEIAGRPVIALEGDLPTYRTLRPGMSGPDVEQLEETLEELGFDPGTVDESYTAATGRAVRALYDEVGYEPPEADSQALSELDTAQQAVESAENEVRNAEQALAAASEGTSESQQVAAQQEVDRAERELEAAEEAGDEQRIAEAEDQLELAEVRLEELLEGPDTSAEEEALGAARSRLSEARATLEQAQVAASTPMPASEVVYVASLPRRVDAVGVERGDEVSGPVMTVSGADMVIVANVDDADRENLSEDMTALLDLPTGEQVEAPITGIAAAEGEEATGYDVTITPEELTGEQVEALRAANIRVTIPVTSTEGEVLAVPLAALTAGPGGEARVEVERAAESESEPESVLVEVEVGLTADGYAEVSAVDGDLAEGDLVAVGE